MVGPAALAGSPPDTPTLPMCRSETGRVKWQAGHNRDTRPGVIAVTGIVIVLTDMRSVHATASLRQCRRDGPPCRH